MSSSIGSTDQLICSDREGYCQLQLQQMATWDMEGHTVKPEKFGGALISVYSVVMLGYLN